MILQLSSMLDILLYCTRATDDFHSSISITCGAWWFSGRVGALRLEGCNFESYSNHHLGTMGKSFTRSCLLLFGALTLIQYQCCSRERFIVVADLKRCLGISGMND